MKELHQKYMHRAIELAILGKMNVAPNPMVGCVIVYNNEIIGEGYHQKYGGPHAEVNALNSVKDKSLLKKSTLYVTLEPCAHYGKTPPCSDLIIQSAIPKVVIGTEDPFSKVAGKGIEKLKDEGVEVTLDILQNECRELNKRFFTYHTKKRPYVILKWAESADGYVDKIREKEEPIGPNWITGHTAKMLVHKWRSEEAAIICGTNTAYFDNPSLNVREWTGKSPMRLVVDRTLRIPNDYKLISDELPTIIFNAEKHNLDTKKQYIKLNFKKNVLQQILDFLYEHEINSLIVEGGTDFIQSFVDENLWDEARVFKGIKYFGNGINSPNIDMAPHHTEPFRCSELILYKNSML